ncbi:cytochrome-c peroxidase [Nitratifractor sp.]
MRPLLITLAVLFGIASLPRIFPPPPDPVWDDAQLRIEAARHNLHSIPRTREGMRKLVDTPDNPITPEKVALGKALYFDPILSRDRTVSCASCHILSEGGDDNRPAAIGYKGRINPHHLNSPMVLNAALEKFEFWDGRVHTVEEQAGGPIQAPFEMNLTPKEAVERLSKNPRYRKMFAQVFGENNVTFANIRRAIGAYERTLLTRGAFDEFLDGNDSALSPAAKRGMTLFMARGCAGCHAGISVGGQFVKRFPLRRYVDDYLGFSFTPRFHWKTSEFPFDNVGDFHGREGRDFFRVPVLRNVARTAPYFHNGSVRDLHEAVRIMSKYQLGRQFTPSEINDTVAFLKSLSGRIVDYGY